MDTSQYDSQIQDAQSDIKKMQGSMDTVRLAFVESTTRYISEWTEKSIERAVTSKPETTKSIGMERLKDLKSALKKLLSEIPSLVPQHIKQDSLWPHRTELPADIYKKSLPIFELKRKTSEELREGVRDLLGYAGQLLVEYGYEESGKDGSWEERAGKPPRYKYGFSWSNEMSTNLKEYVELLESYVDTHIKVINLKREKAEAEAKNLWDEA
jgi:hypothetical protein